ncbi:MAG: hypothetical protein SPL12_00275 [Bacteroidales bacterium]|nr:hypothetical protein [Bacteroidales bacterium]
MENVANKNNLTIKLRPRKNVWKLPYDVFGHFRKKFDIEIALKDFQVILDTTYAYYLNEMGLSVNTDGAKVDKLSAQYMWAQLDKCKTATGENLYVWMTKKDNGTFGNIAFGTKAMFDANIVESLKKQKI